MNDDSEAAVSGNGSIGTTTPLAYPAIAFDAGSEFRYGLLKLGSAYGSELIALAVPLELQYWNGSQYVPVPLQSTCGVAGNVENVNTFTTSINTTRLRLQITSRSGLSTGVLEWKAFQS